MRRAHVLALVVLLGACEHGPQSTSSVDASAPKAETTQGAPTPAVKAKPAASEVYRRPGDPATGIDELAFWGWSEDGRYFAVETYHHGADMVECEGEAELTIFDAEANRPAEDGSASLRSGPNPATIFTMPSGDQSSSGAAGPSPKRNATKSRSSPDMATSDHVWTRHAVKHLGWNLDELGARRLSDRFLQGLE